MQRGSERKTAGRWSRIHRSVPARGRALAVLGAAGVVALGLLTASDPPGSRAGTPASGSVIVLIGDGMGPGQRGASQLYSYGTEKSGKIQPMDDLPEGGMLYTQSLSHATTDSSASATAMGTGRKTINNVAGIDLHGNRLTNLTEIAHQQGKAVGLVEDNDVTNATMAGFAAHVGNRDHKVGIANDYLFETKPDVIMGGGEEVWYPRGNEGKIPDRISDDRSIGRRNLVKVAEKRGYQYAYNRKTFAKLDGPKALALVQEDALLRTWELPRYSRAKDPHYVPEWRLVGKALQLLNQNPNGFFMAIDVDQVDDAGHDRNGRQVIASTKIVNRIVSTIQSYREHNPNVLLVVTGDHETGGLMVENSQSEPTEVGGNVPPRQRSGPFRIKGTHRSFNTDWTTSGHTGIPVPVTAVGPHSDQFNGVHDNTAVFYAALGVLTGAP